MKKFNKTPISLAIAAVASLNFSAIAANEQPKAEQKEFETIIVTGVTRAASQMKSSVSSTVIDLTDVEVATPRTTAEIFRSIPGVRSESTGGEGNANIAVRGLPVAAGGAKFLVLQEDGLPIMQFGDIAFGNSDIFLRADSTVSTIEVIRGGSASTMASNSPGGIINFISKTGESDGGSVASTFGLDYQSVRTDFEFGGDLGNDTRFHIGGFYRQGDGARDAGYTANKGGQIKANFTKEFDTGYVRVYLKHLDDRSIGYLPMPMYSDGSSISGFNALTDTPHSVYLQQTLRLDGNGNRSTGDLQNGMHPMVNSVGLEVSLDLIDGWNLINRFRYSDVSGQFVSPFPAEVASASTIAESIAGAGATLEYAVGPNAGTAFTDSTGNGLVMRIHTFDVEMEDFDNYTNDLKLSKDLGELSVSFGLYRSSQNIGMSWLWNSYLMEVKGDNAALLNVVAEDGTEYSDSGLYAYGTPAWGNCCQRNYDAKYDITAPYISVAGELDNINWDVSIRRDMGVASGTYSGPTSTSQIDMNRDGVISIAEQNVVSIDLANPSIIDYDWGYTSFSAGLNYIVSDDLAIFGRVSQGGRANADRLLFGKVRADGSVATADAIDMVDQFEFGAKYRASNYSLFATAFVAETEEQNYEATTQTFFDRVYDAKGLELEGSYRLDELEFKGGLTWTDAEIAKDQLNESVVGNTPRRQADFIYQATITYSMANTKLGVNAIGTTGAYAQDNNDLKFDGYTQFNLFADYLVTDNLTVSFNVNNVTDAVGLTEAEEGSVPSNGIIRARAINGRTSSVTLKYMF